jgi:hypothetical protein
MTPTLTYRSNASGFDFAPSRATGKIASNLLEQLRKLIEAGQSAETLQGRAIRELEDTFLDCRCGNWDGHGASAVRDAGFLQAKEFLALAVRRFPAPTASAMPGGSLTLEWIASPSRRFMVSLSGDDQIAYAGVFGSATVQGTATFVNDVPMEISKHLVRLFFS